MTASWGAGLLAIGAAPPPEPRKAPLAYGTSHAGIDRVYGGDVEVELEVRREGDAVVAGVSDRGRWRPELRTNDLAAAKVWLLARWGPAADGRLATEVPAPFSLTERGVPGGLVVRFHWGEDRWAESVQWNSLLSGLAWAHAAMLPWDDLADGSPGRRSPHIDADLAAAWWRIPDLTLPLLRQIVAAHRR